MVFYMTDSSTVEGAVDRENYPSSALFEHLLRIKRIQFKFKFVPYAIYCFGTIMMCQGIEGVSRVILNQVLISGKPIRACMLLNLSAHDRFPDIKV